MGYFREKSSGICFKRLTDYRWVEWKDDVKDLIAFDVRRAQLLILGFLWFLVVLWYLGVYLFSKLFSLCVCIFGPILNYIIIRAHYSGSIKVKKFAFGDETKFGVVFKAGLNTTG